MCTFIVIRMREMIMGDNDNNGNDDDDISKRSSAMIPAIMNIVNITTQLQ